MSVSPVPPASFDPVDDRNGVPGDAGAVGDLARRYANTAAEIESQAAHLRTLTSQARSSWKSEAGDNFVSVAGDLSERIVKAQGRYEAAARALNQYADGLADVQTDAYDAVRRAQAAEDEQRALRNSDPTPAGAGATPEQVAAAGEARRLHDNAVQAAGDRLSTATSDYREAVEEYHRIARDAAGILRNGRDDDVADGWWDRNAGWISKVLDVLSAIALVLTIAAVIIAVVATGGTLLAALVPLLLAGSTLLTGVSLLGHTALWATDNGSLSDVLWDLAGVLTLGLGKGVTAGARGLLSVASRTGGRVAGARAGRAAFSAAGRSSLLYDVGRFVPFARPVMSLSPGLRASFGAADSAAATASAGVATAAATAASSGLTRGLAMADLPTAQALSAINHVRQTVGNSAQLSVLTGLAGAMVVGGTTVPGVVTNGKSALDIHTNFFAEPAQEARDQAARADIVDQWSMPLSPHR
ncbi:WXG100 family type VII secretion target [Blastococcus haudaquaticus]|uniref:Membrane protein DedA, SNARE-associated domain n=1 Tax=Blastococcus haudaquaticus TaxID=1938745 RepID=A0A286GBP8_9ACTN|nr:WXG100 family type VII secretion target [Blastococcus haudaquaticus]SOD92955.1 membrane protein DedA, SNARE-associated domain [Blastococcus haudaquaticus]